MKTMTKTFLYALILILVSVACTKLEVFAPQGEDGAKGDPGMSAYETWLDLLDKGQYPNWQGGRTEADFLIFLSGKKGENGRSAYEEWKRMIASGQVEDPHNSGSNWFPSRNTERDFFWFLTGAKGAQGDKGDKGPQGDKGDKGPQGDKGSKGNKGDKGDKGDKGIQGDKGDKGDKGAQGDKGDKGIQGDKGDRGPQGDKGDKGAQGAQGDKGAPGKAGEKGDKGDPGAKGNTGAQGDKGDPGAKGNEGAKGDPGAPGEKGAQGDKGNPGAKGDPGASGAAGSNGAAGASAFDIWAQMAAAGTLPNPHPTLPGYAGTFWPKDKVSMDDFWVYLRGEDGKNSTKLLKDYILTFQHIQPKDDEKPIIGYDVLTGDAVLRLTDRDVNAVAKGTTVVFGTDFGLATPKTYVVGDNGLIRIPQADLLPNGTEINQRSGRATVSIGGKTEETNLFVFPTQIKEGPVVWTVWNDWGAGIIRAELKHKYIIDAAGSMASVELAPRIKEYSHHEVYSQWRDAELPDRSIIFDITDINGVVQIKDARVDDVGYARYAGTPAARRHLNFEGNDLHKIGYLFKDDNGRIFNNDSYYVRTKAIPKYFGFSGTIQSPVIEVPPMPRVPLISKIKFDGGTATGEIEELNAAFKDKLVTGYQPAPGNPNLWIPKYGTFGDDTEVHFVLTKIGISYISKAKLGDRTFTFTVPTTPSDLVGLKVIISSPASFDPAGATSEAILRNQQPNFRPVLLGVIELDTAGNARIKYSADLGMTEPYVPLMP